MKYELFVSEMSGSQLIKRYNDNQTISFIPMDEANSEYQAYLKSLDEASPL